MAEELKSLIEKIKEEGVRAAEDRAKEIESEARRNADSIIKKAQAESERLISEAKDKIARMESSGKSSLSQAGRDLLITVRKEINAMLDRLIASHVHKALNPDEITKIIHEIVKSPLAKSKEGLIVSLKKEDLEKLEKGLFAELRTDTRKGITLKAADDIRGGFMISYDNGKSYYDFTDKAMTEYISSYLKPKLAGILQ